MSNRETLKPQAHVLTVEEQSKGGRASVQKRRERKALRECLEAALSAPCDHPGITCLHGGMTNAEAVAVALVEKALSGDVRAFVEIRDTLGERPVQQLQIDDALRRDQAKFAELLEQLEA